MKITQLKTAAVEIPLPNPIKTAIHDIRSVGCILVYLETDQGLMGESYVFSINAVRLKVFDEMINSLAHQVVGRDPHFIEAIWHDIWAEINPIGHKGISIYALSALDTACWDLIGKAAEKPLHHIFGACRARIKTYASGGLWLSQTIDELLIEAEGFIDQGFQAMKLRIGHDNAKTDVERVREVRDAIGPDIELMVDANQSFTPKHAIRLGRQLEAFDLSWFEEPVAAYDLRGHADVRAALDTPIASGETEYTRYGFRDMIQNRACDILMPDLQRIGGLSEMRKTAALAASFDQPISSHIFTEQSLCIAGSSANCISIEHMPWFAPLFKETIQIKQGEIEIPTRPGLGFQFEPDAVKNYTIS